MTECERGSPWAPRRLLINFVVALVSLVLVLVVNPFGWESANDAHVERVMQGIFAPLHDSQDAARHITVVLIDPRYFENQTDPAKRKVSWPLPANDFLDKVLGPIVVREPRSIFIDLSFPDAPRDTGAAPQVAGAAPNPADAALDLLGNRIARYAQEVPIFIADGVVGDRTTADPETCESHYVADDTVRANNILSDRFLTAAFAGAAPPEGLAIVNASWIGEGDGYPLAPVQIGPKADCLSRDESGAGSMLSPALALYADLYTGVCVGGDRRGIDDADVKRLCTADALGKHIVAEPPRRDLAYGTYTLSGPARERLSINWGHYLTPQFSNSFRDAPGSDLCFDQFVRKGTDAPDRAQRIARAASSFTDNLFRRAHERVRTCVYIDTISAGDLTSTNAHTAEIAASFIANRIVILGVALPQAKDYFVSPINGQIPGAYLHAAALENLITYGADFKTEDVPDSHRAFNFLIVLLVAVLFPALWATFYKTRERVAPWQLAALAVAATVYGAIVIANFDPAGDHRGFNIALVGLSAVALVAMAATFFREPRTTLAARLAVLAVAGAVYGAIIILIALADYALTDSATRLPLRVLALPIVLMFVRLFTDFIEAFEHILGARPPAPEA